MIISKRLWMLIRETQIQQKLKTMKVKQVKLKMMLKIRFILALLLSQRIKDNPLVFHNKKMIVIWKIEAVLEANPKKKTENKTNKRRILLEKRKREVLVIAEMKLAAVFHTILAISNLIDLIIKTVLKMILQMKLTKNSEKR